jgi:cation diffusion facilitator CzcD-associated flavoprotein CzcO
VERAPHTHVAIVGTGFSGLGLAIRLRQAGLDDFVILERAHDVGGTWRDNTYPGCACDVPSHLYSFSFALNPAWTRAYSPQAEIQAYLRACAERYGLVPHICWGADVLAAHWDDTACVWRLTTTQGLFTADLLAMGNGPLSEPSLPPIPGLDRFAGTIFHSARWDHSHDLRNERIAVIGTGASAVQFMPRIQPLATRLTLFQRTPPWVISRRDHAIPAWQRRIYRAAPFTQRLPRALIYWQREFAALGLVYRPNLLKSAERLALRHLKAQVADPALRAQLTPAYTMGCKRILLSDDFYPALTQRNTELVTERIRSVKRHTITTEDGAERQVDTIILATGFHVTDMPMAGNIIGGAGRTLAEVWGGEPQAHLGVTVAGFPNLFLMIGPNTGLGHTSMIYMIEAQIAYILDCLRFMRRTQTRAIEPQLAAQSAYNAEVQRRMGQTVWTTGGCASWYLDAQGRNTTLWPGFTWEYRSRTRHFDPASYHQTPA